MIRAAVFDFDGVIAESTDIKTEAFRRLFDGDERAVEYHEANMGVSRYDKFRHITTEILGRTYTPEDERRLGERFSELVVDEVVRCPFVPGARELLERLAGELPLFVASATPEDEVRRIVSLRGLDGAVSGRVRHAGDQGGDPAADRFRGGLRPQRSRDGGRRAQ